MGVDVAPVAPVAQLAHGLQLHAQALNHQRFLTPFMDGGADHHHYYDVIQIGPIGGIITICRS